MKSKQVTNILGNWSLGRGTLHHRLAVAIVDAIHQGNFLPGTKLPAERSMATALAVSRTTVLNAYNTLRAAGWLESRPGSGTWVNRAGAIAARASTQSGVIARSPLLHLLSVRDSGAIDFAVTSTGPIPGFPPDAFDLPAELRQSLLAERSYLPFGLPMLRDAIALHYSKLGLPTIPDEILVTTGGQQAISLAIALYVQRGDPVLVENPTYFGALEAFRFAGARMAPINIPGSRHIVPDVLKKRILTTHPRLIYLTPSYQNPTGACMPQASRRDVARICSDYGVPLIEDDCLAEITFERKRIPPIAAEGDGENILTVGCLSKLFCPGIRVGWIRAAVPVIARLVRVKTAMDLGSPLLTQAIGAQFLSEMDKAVELRRKELTKKLRLAAEILRREVPDWEFEEPSGGLCLWIRIPNGDARTLAQVALRHRVGVASGNLFSIDDGFADFLRIPFVLGEDEIALGIERLAESWREVNGVKRSGEDRYSVVI
jgi:DNA-binding transcriptional MocR family regulator